MYDNNVLCIVHVAMYFHLGQTAVYPQMIDRVML